MKKRSVPAKILLSAAAHLATAIAFCCAYLFPAFRAFLQSGHKHPGGPAILLMVCPALIVTSIWSDGRFLRDKAPKFRKRHLVYIGLILLNVIITVGIALLIDFYFKRQGGLSL